MDNNDVDGEVDSSSFKSDQVNHGDLWISFAKTITEFRL